jgi:hypothetical protein
VFALDSKIFEPFPPVNLLCFHPERFVRGICVCGFVIWHLFRRTLRGGSKASSRSNRNNSLAITSVATVLQDFSLSLSHLFTVSLCLANPAAFSVFFPLWGRGYTLQDRVSACEKQVHTDCFFCLDLFASTLPFAVGLENPQAM